MMKLLTILILSITLNYVIRSDVIMECPANINQYMSLGKVNGYDLLIDPTPQFFAQALEKIYEDENHIYFLREIKSHIYVLRRDNVCVGLKEGLENQIISINNLLKVLPEVIIEKKSQII